MIPLDTCLAVVLLTCPPTDAPIGPGSLQHLASVRVSVQTLALEWELLDPREVKFVLSRKEDFEGDLRLVQRRCVELANAPSLADCFRFPDRATANGLISFNRAYKENILQRQLLDRSLWQEYQEVLSEIEYLYEIWDLVRDARCEYYYVTVRRQALQKLRVRLGDFAYNDGALPPHVPLWRFVKID